MTRRRICVLGGTGMLGSMLVDYISRQGDVDLLATARKGSEKRALSAAMPDVRWEVLRVDFRNMRDRLEIIDGCDWVINAIGKTKPYIDETDARSVEAAILVNSLFPHALAEEAETARMKVLHVTSDCVFSGKAKRSYDEGDAHDAEDVYGKTKSLGEVASTNVLNIRTSIIGPEPRERGHLMGWFLQQNKVKGYTNHLWNGVTTLHLAKICDVITQMRRPPTGTLHVCAGDWASKCRLLSLLALAYDLDVELTETVAQNDLDRRLSTSRTDEVGSLWREAYYDEAPEVERMVRELAAYEYRMAGILK